MKTRTEFVMWIERGDPVTDGDIDRLVETAEQYILFAQGRPDIHAYLNDDTLCILVAATAEEPSASRDRAYIRDRIRRALSDARMAP